LLLARKLVIANRYLNVCRTIAKLVPDWYGKEYGIDTNQDARNGKSMKQHRMTNCLRAFGQIAHWVLPDMRICRRQLVGSLAVVLIAGAWGRAGPITELPNDQIFVHAHRELDANMLGCKTIDWSAANNRLLVDRRGLNKYYNIFSITTEGYRLKPLTFSKDGGASARQHSGNGAWHPDGNHFVFTSQNASSSAYRESMPSIGWHCNLFLTDREGLRFWQLTDIPTNLSAPQGVVFPSFSPDGKKLFWAGTTGDGQPSTPWQSRALFMADFRFEKNRPRLENIQKFQPGKNHDFYESYGFSPDGRKIIFGGNLKEGQPWYSMDLYSFANGDVEPARLTSTPQTWDRHASCSPDGKKIVWACSSGFNIRYLGTGGNRWTSYLRTELWLMDADGKNQKQLTFLNASGPRKYVRGNRCFVGDSAWSSDGNSIAVILYYETRRRDVESIVLILELGKGPPSADEGEAGAGKPRTKAPQKSSPISKPDQRVTPAVPKW